ncbi:MAG: tyrosine-type recombinase/integrase [Flavobacteriaceae bacterium]|nr:tyrosine-type recombinase/integrase [Flavobacteriaceae bacterium]
MRARKVKIREVENKNGTISIVLDCHMGYYVDVDGKKKQNRKRRFLDFKLVKDAKTPIEKQYNKDCLAKARLIANKWENSIISEEYNLEDTEKTTSLVYAYIIKETDRIKDKGTRQAYKTMTSHFLKHFPKAITFKQINRRQQAKAFYDYLTEKALKKNGDNLSIKSANKYFKRLRLIMKEAKLEGYIEDLRFDLKLLPEKKPDVVYLTLEEFRKLENTEESNTTMKNAFLFACLTALRIGDLHSLTWGEIKEENDKIWYDRIMDKKPNGKERRISNNFELYAKKYLGERQGDSDKVFPALPKDASSKFNERMNRWILRAGIHKKITFHCAKHSFAMYKIIHKEVGVYKLAKLLNHSDIRSSMHYYDLCSPDLKEKLM